MAFLGKTYEFAGEAQSSFDVIPAGWYKARVTDSKLKDTRAGNGKYLEVSFVVTGPKYEGRFVWGRFNLENPSEKAVEIGHAQFQELCQAVGVQSLDDSDVLHGRELQIKIAVAAATDQFDESNDVKRYKPIDASVPAAAPASAAPAFATTKKAPAAPAGAKGATPPWNKKPAEV